VAVRAWPRSADDQLGPDASVIPVAVVVGHEFPNSAPQVAVTERDDAIEALFLDRADEPFRVRFAVRRPERR
jgi:hypothetical protein